MSNKIISLSASNVQRVELAEVVLNGKHCIVSGDNEQGKTSLLDMLIYAFEGGRSISSDPVRHGSEKGVGKIVMEGGITIERIFKKNGAHELKVSVEPYGNMKSPQDVLDNLFGKNKFIDPVSFIKDPNRDDTLRKIAKVDVTDLNRKMEEIYRERTIIGRDLKAKQGQLKGAKKYDIQENEEINISSLVSELQNATKHNADIEKKKEEIVRAEEKISAITMDILSIDEKIKELEKTKSELSERLQKGTEWIDDANKKLSEYRQVDISLIQNKINTAEDINGKVRANKLADSISAEIVKIKENYDSCTNEIDKIDREKDALLSEASFPIEGLSFSETGNTTYKGVPFEQCSKEEKIRVSIAVAFAANPKLPFVIVRDGESIDHKNMMIIKKFIDERGGQMFMERVGDFEDKRINIIFSAGDTVGVLMEDGKIKDLVNVKGEK